MSDQDKSSHSEYDHKWLNAKYAHLVGNVIVIGDDRQRFAAFIENFGRAHGFAVTVDRDRPGPPGGLPFIHMVRNDGVDIDASDLMDNRRASFSVRQPAPRSDWKAPALELLQELTAQFPNSVVVTRGAWLPIGEGEIVAALWGGSRKLNLESERRFQGVAQGVAEQLRHEAVCLEKSCELTYQFSSDRLYSVQLAIRHLKSDDRLLIYDSIAHLLRSYLGPPTSGRDAVRWRINFMQTELKWHATGSEFMVTLAYTHQYYVSPD